MQVYLNFYCNFSW